MTPSTRVSLTDLAEFFEEFAGFVVLPENTREVRDVVTNALPHKDCRENRN